MKELDVKISRQQSMVDIISEMRTSAVNHLSTLLGMETNDPVLSVEIMKKVFLFKTYLDDQLGDAIAWLDSYKQIRDSQKNAEDKEL